MARKNPSPPVSSDIEGIVTDSRPASVRLADDAASQLITTPDDHLGRQSLIKQVSVPLPAPDLATLEVLAERLGKSRGAMVAWAAEIGSQLIIDRIGDPEVRSDLLTAISSRQQAVIDELSGVEG